MKKTHDAIIVLGVSTERKAFAPRVETAVRLFQQGRVPYIIFSGRYWGGLVTKPETTEARAMANYARSLGMPQKYIYIEERSLNTIGNFYFIKKEILKPLKLRSLLIITKAEHLQKSRFLAKKILGPKYRLAWKTDGALRMKARSDHAQLSDIKQFFKDIRDGDDKKIAVLLRAHKYYRRYRKF